MHIINRSRIIGIVAGLSVLVFSLFSATDKASAVVISVGGTCEGVPATIFVGESVTWTASGTLVPDVTWLNHFYTHFWSGTDGLSGNTQSVTKTYETAGTKTATVLITAISDEHVWSEQISATCSILVIPPPSRLVLSSITCDEDSAIRVHFVVNQLPSGVSDYGSVTYVINGITRTAGFIGANQGTAHYAEVVSGVQSPYSVSSAFIIIDGIRSFMENPQTVSLDCPLPPPSECKLEITKLVDKTSAYFGDTLTYTINVKNTGTADCTGGGVHIKDVVDTRLQYLSETHSSNIISGYGSAPIYISSLRLLQWNAGILTPGESGSIMWKGQVKTPVSCGSYDIPNKASVSSYEYNNFGTWVESNTVITTVSNDCPPPALVGVCTASPLTVLIGDPVTYTATATGGTGTYAYSWTGTDGLSGNAQNVEKIYASAGTKTAQVTVTSGVQIKTVECSVTVTAPPEPTPFTAICSVSPSTIYVNESVTWSVTASGGTGTYTYTWTGTDGLSDTTKDVTKTYTSAGTKNAVVTVTSGSDTVSASCSINVLPPPGCTSNCGGGGGGGGFDSPNVVLFKKSPEGRVLSAVYLSQIPYTGIGDWYKIPLFILIIAVWSASVVYFLRSKSWYRKKKGRELEVSPAIGNMREKIFEVRGEEVSVGEWTPEGITNQENYNMTHMHSTHNKASTIPVGEKEVVPQNGSSAGVVDVIAAEAQRHRTVISEEGMHYIAQKCNYSATEALSLVDRVIKSADIMFSRDEGWLLLNKEKVVSSLSQKTEAPDSKVHAVSTPAPVQSTQVFAHKSEPIQSFSEIHIPPSTTSEGRISGSTNVDNVLFVTWLATGDKSRVVQHLRHLRTQNGSAESFVKKVVLDLDAVYRSRFEELDEAVDMRLAHTVSGLSNVDLEKLVSALLSVFDQNYHSASLGVKLALMRAQDIGKGK